MLNESVVELRGVRLHMRRGGEGKPVLFLHGPQGLAGAEPALETLAQRFDVLAPDHPGFGRSDTPDWLDDVPDYAFFYLDLIETLGFDRVHLVGHSLGGWITLEMAVRSTQRIASIVLAASAGIRVKDTPRADMFICTPDELARLLFAGDGWKAWAEAQQATPDAQDALDKNRFAAAKLCWQPRLFDPKLEKWLHRIDRPVRILWGEEDKIIPAAYGRRLAEMIPGASMALVPRAGHALPIEAPDRFAEEAARFIAGIAP